MDTNRLTSFAKYASVREMILPRHRTPLAPLAAGDKSPQSRRSITVKSLMKKICISFGIGFACLCALIGTTARAADDRIVLIEHLNRGWTNEWVTYPFSAKNGDCAMGSVRLTGPAGSQSVQLSGVEYWPGTAFVKTAAVAFVVGELAPLSTNAYTVTSGSQAAPQAPVASDLVVAVTTDQVSATSSRFGLRCLLGEKTYDPPAAAAAVPGPIQGLRLADGTWFGGSRLFGDTSVAGYTARVTDNGPVFVRVECAYRYADGHTNTIAIQLNAQGNRLYFTDDRPALQPADGWDLLLTGLPPLAFQFMPEQQGFQPKTHLIQGGWKERELADYEPGLITKLAPWGDWFDEFTQTKLYLAFLDTRPAGLVDLTNSVPDARELVIQRLDAGAWVRTDGSSDSRKAVVPLLKGTDGSVYLHVNGATQARRWTVGENSSLHAKLHRVFNPRNVMPDEMEDLNFVKELILEWPSPPLQHPQLFLNAPEMQAAGARLPEALKSLRDVKGLREALASDGFFDTMRKSAEVICRYDAIIDSDLITPAERKLFRAQMAYLAYRLASPANWSLERGYASGNKNMTVAHVVNQGLAACVLQDHPQAKFWSEQPLASMNMWMDRLDPAGNWPESSGYARASESKFIFYAVAAQRAGFGNFLADPRFKRMVLYYERTMTPPDPQRVMTNSPKNEPHHPRVTPPYGRGGNANSVGLGGVVAKAIATLDPAFSRILQWSYAGSCFSTGLGEPMAGYDQLLADPALPAERPDWHSELLPSVGALFRSGVGEPDENYLLLVAKNATNTDGEIWPSEVGALETWFAHGKPMTRMFPAYPYDNYHGLLCNRVMLATNWKPGQTATAGYNTQETMTGFAALPRLDYIGETYQWLSPWTFFPTPPKGVPAFPVVPQVGILPPVGKPPVTWQRQALYVRDDQPGGMNYLVLRDTVTGGQPTQWQFWTLSQRLSAPGGASAVAERKAEPLEDLMAGGKPPAAIGLLAEPKLSEASQLQGDRFTALGQFGVDVDYFIASPTNTPRNTLRYATTSPYSGVVFGFPLEQDLLHLQLPGDGNYFVALVPRSHAETSPIFTALGDGQIIKVAGAFGTDYNFLTTPAGHAAAELATFSGTVSSVQDRTNGLVLALGAAGSVAFKNHGLIAPMAANLRIASARLTLTLTESHTGGVVTVTAPGNWKLEPTQSLVKLKKTGTAEYSLTIPANVQAVSLSGR